jgi:hypothetical protein
VFPGVTDIDLLVSESESSFALVSESIANDDRLIEGVTQATNSCEYLRNNPDFLRAQLELPRDHEIQQVEGVVVCRGLSGTGSLERVPNIPIITETAFVELMAETRDLPHPLGALNRSSGPSSCSSACGGHQDGDRTR